ncbi:MAG: hypothetical protein ACLUSP_06120 [Christensenellales bacterium]
MRSTDVFTFGAAYNAESYDVYVDGATDPISCDTTSCDLSANPLAAGTHSIRVVAKRGDASRERTYSLTVGERPVFNVETAAGSTEYILADFETVEYNEYLALAGERASMGQTKYSVKDGNSLSIRSSKAATIKSSYTFPEPITKANMLNIKVKFSTTNSIKIYAFDELGNKTGTDKDGEWLGGGNMDVSTYTGFRSFAGDKITAIAFTLHNWQKQAVVNIDEITYEYIDPVTNFNTKVEGTENEYLLADFSVSGYKQYLENVGSGRYSLVENGLSVTGANWNNNAVKYTLPSSIAVGDIEKIKVEFIVTGGKHGVVRASDGTNYSGSNTDVSPMEFTIDTTEITGDKIVSFLLSCNDTSTAIVYTKITYVKKTA